MTVQDRRIVSPAAPVLCRMCLSADTTDEAPIAGWQLRTCQRCGLTFAPEVTPALVEPLYQAGRGIEDAPCGGWASDDRFLEPAWSHLPTDTRLDILDFGSGRSCLPHLLRERGHAVVRLDLMPIDDGDPDRMVGGVERFDGKQSLFHLVVAYQVFEHLPEPRAVFLALLRLTKPGGLLAVHTDMEAPARHEPLREWSYVCPPDHCSFFRHETFDLMAAEATCDVVWRDPWCVMLQKGRDGSATSGEADPLAPSHGQRGR